MRPEARLGALSGSKMVDFLGKSDIRGTPALNSERISKAKGGCATTPTGKTA